MPLIDMPISKLEEYRGINPKPADFDEYWERALKEMNDVSPMVEIKESKYQFPGIVCYDMYFTGTKNSRIYAKLLKPKVIKDKAPAILRFHGYSGRSDDWMQYSYYASVGFVVAALDARGQAGKSEDKNPVSGTTHKGMIIRGLDDPNPDNLHFRQVFLDTALLAKIIMNMEDVDEKRVAVAGGSQGGGLSLACASLVPEISLAAVHYPFLSDYKRVWEMDLAERAYLELQDFFRYFDPRHEREDEIFTKLGYIDIKNLSNRIKAETLMFTGLMDSVCPPSTQFASYNNITSKKSYILYPDFGHENLPDTHDMVADFITSRFL